MANESKRTEPGRAASTPAARTPQKGTNSANSKEKQSKPMSAFSMFLICFLLFAILCVSAFAVLNFNLFDMRIKAIVLLAAGSSPYETERAELTQLQLQLDDRGQQQALKEQELIKLQDTLDKQVKAQDNEQLTLDARREEIDQLFANYAARVADFDKIVAIYGAMEPARAAEALSLIENIDDIARIMSALKKDIAAKILNNMDAALAAGVTQRMLP